MLHTLGASMSCAPAEAQAAEKASDCRTAPSAAASGPWHGSCGYACCTTRTSACRDGGSPTACPAHTRDVGAVVTGAASRVTAAPPLPRALVQERNTHQAQGCADTPSRAAFFGAPASPPSRACPRQRSPGRSQGQRARQGAVCGRDFFGAPATPTGPPAAARRLHLPPGRASPGRALLPGASGPRTAACPEDRQPDCRNGGLPGVDVGPQGGAPLRLRRPGARSPPGRGAEAGPGRPAPPPPRSSLGARAGAAAQRPARARDWLFAGAGDPARDAQAAAEGGGACGGRRAGAGAAARPAASPAAAPPGVWGAWQPWQREGGAARARGACLDWRSEEEREQDGAWPLAGWQQAEGEALAWAYCHDVYSDNEPEQDEVWVPLLAGSSQEEGEARARAARLDPHPEEESEEDPVWPPWSREEGEALRAREAGLDLHSEDCNPSKDEREQDGEQDGERALAAWQQAEGEALLRAACLDSNSEDETEDEWEQDGEWVLLRWLAAPPRPAPGQAPARPAGRAPQGAGPRGGGAPAGDPPRALSRRARARANAERRERALRTLHACVSVDPLRPGVVNRLGNGLQALQAAPTRGAPDVWSPPGARGERVDPAQDFLRGGPAPLPRGAPRGQSRPGARGERGDPGQQAPAARGAGCTAMSAPGARRRAGQPGQEPAWGPRCADGDRRAPQAGFPGTQSALGDVAGPSWSARRDAAVERQAASPAATARPAGRSAPGSSGCPAGARALAGAARVGLSAGGCGAPTAARAAPWEPRARCMGDGRDRNAAGAPTQPAHCGGRGAAAEAEAAHDAWIRHERPRGACWTAAEEAVWELWVRQGPPPPLVSRPGLGQLQEQHVPPARPYEVTAGLWAGAAPTRPERGAPGGGGGGTRPGRSPCARAEPGSGASARPPLPEAPGGAGAAAQAHAHIAALGAAARRAPPGSGTGLAELQQACRDVAVREAEDARRLEQHFGQRRPGRSAEAAAPRNPYARRRAAARAARREAEDINARATMLAAQALHAVDVQAAAARHGADGRVAGGHWCLPREAEPARADAARPSLRQQRDGAAGADPAEAAMSLGRQAGAATRAVREDAAPDLPASERSAPGGRGAGEEWSLPLECGPEGAGAARPSPGRHRNAPADPDAAKAAMRFGRQMREAVNAACGNAPLEPLAPLARHASERADTSAPVSDGERSPPLGGAPARADAGRPSPAQQREQAARADAAEGAEPRADPRSQWGPEWPWVGVFGEALPDARTRPGRAHTRLPPDPWQDVRSGGEAGGVRPACQRAARKGCK